MAIRAFVPDDLEPIVRIWAVACEATHSFLPPKFLQEAECHLRQTLLKPEATVVFDDGGVRGFITATRGHVVSLFVDPSHHRLGIGSSLLSKAKETFSSLELSVFVENTSGVLFYRHHGFLVVKRAPFPKADREVLIMRWTRA